MAIVSIVNIDEIEIQSADWEELIDMILDAYNRDRKHHPVVDYIAEVLHVKQWVVSDAFRYYRAFNKWPKTDPAHFIQTVGPGADFWFSLYACYNRKSLYNSYKNMFEKIVELL